MCNSRGFSALPTELLHHIASQIQETTVAWYQERSYEGQRNERRVALRALSQLCRSLRVAFLPLVWQTLEGYTLTRPYFEDDQLYITAQMKAVGKLLLGQIRLIRDAKQPYASYVRVITVAIYSRFANDTLAELAGAMMLMPNLHTIQIMCGPYGGPFANRIERKRFRKAFAGLTFPSVKRVIFPDHASAVFGCFPEAVEVFTNQTLSFKFIDDMFSHCPKVETIGWKMNLFTGPGCSRFLVERSPNLRRIECYLTWCNVDEIMQLLPLNLEKITLVCPVGSKEPSQMIEAAQQILARSSFSTKCLEVISGSERRTIDIGDKPS